MTPRLQSKIRRRDPSTKNAKTNIKNYQKASKQLRLVHSPLKKKTATPKRNQVHITKSGEYAFAHVYFVQVFLSIIAFLQLCRSPRFIFLDGKQVSIFCEPIYTVTGISNQFYNVPRMVANHFPENSLMGVIWHPFNV